MAKEIILKNVSKQFTTKSLGTVTAVENFNLEIEEGECFAFLGPSGCGKTTTLRMIAGFEDLSDGEISLSGRVVSSKEKHLYIPPEERKLGMVFQAFAVWPHMNIFENVAFPLRVQKRPQAEINERVKEALKHTGLDGSANEYPSNLSGGQQQRIALARAIVTNPKIMLLDEPLSNLDPQLRESMRFEIKALQKKFNFTIIFVTHDQAEAMALSDRMLVMDMGKVEQIGTPTELYNKPINRFVHSFLGESSFIKVNVAGNDLNVEGDRQLLHLPIDPLMLKKGQSKGHLLLATRPNTIALLSPEQGDAVSGCLHGTIEQRIFLTNFTEYIVKVGTEKLKVQTPHRIEFMPGDCCCLDLPQAMWYEDDDQQEAIRNQRQII